MNINLTKGIRLLIIMTISVVFGMLTTLGASAAVEDTFTVENSPVTYKITSEGDLKTVEVADCEGQFNGYITLPNEVTNPNNEESYKVTAIGDDAFAMCYSLTGIQIPDSVISIGERAFYDCYCMKEVKIPDRVKSLGAAAFSDCASLKNVDIPNSVESIGENAFARCFYLESIKIPGSIKNIEDIIGK